MSRGSTPRHAQTAGDFKWVKKYLYSRSGNFRVFKSSIISGFEILCEAWNLHIFNFFLP